MRQAQYFNCFYFCLHLCSYWRMKWIFQNIMNRTIKLERIDCKIKNECTAVLHHCCNFDHTWQKFLLASAWSHGSFFTEKVVTCCSQAYLKFGGMAFLPPGYACGRISNNDDLLYRQETISLIKRIKWILLCLRVIPCLIEHPCSPTLSDFDESRLIWKSFKNNNQQKNLNEIGQAVTEWQTF